VDNKVQEEDIVRLGSGTSQRANTWNMQRTEAWPAAGWRRGVNTRNCANGGTLPGGHGTLNGENFGGLGKGGGWWTATEYSSTRAYDRGMNYSYENVSVRCLKN